MCIVSYIPTGKSSFILSSNRDEIIDRSVSNLTLKIINNEEVLFPREIKGGSWIFASSSQQIVCVLNGGFVKHKHDPPYARSRGLIMRDFFNYDDAVHFFSKIDLYLIEPFTCVVYDRNQLFQFVWDGQVKNVKDLDIQEKHVWSSSTLYPPEIQVQRRKWFEDWFEKNPEVTLENVIELHRNGGKGDVQNGYVMNRNNVVCTVSITHVIKSQSHIEMIYEDLLKKEIMKSSVNINQLLA